MKVIAVVLCYNSLKYISHCLESLKSVETVVVDNASSDSSVEFIRISFPKIKIIKNSQNLGYAGGNNVGVKYAIENGADFVWIVNPDVRVDKNARAELIKVAGKYHDGAIFGSKCYFEKGFEFHKDRYSKNDLGNVIWYAGGDIDWNNVQTVHMGINEVDKGQYNQIIETEFVTGASMFIRTEALNQVGLLDEKYFLYFEETDLCQRIKQANWKLYYVPTSIVWHANALATGVGSPLVDYYTTRNRMLFGLRWAPLRSKLALIRESMRLLFNGRIWQKKGIADFYLNKFGKGSYV